jgi:UDP-MurNAc hydroxylase
VLISHIHWDHWHGISLKKYFKGCKFLIPDQPKTRSYDDLVRLRLGQVELIKHGKTLHLGDNVKVTVYEFGLLQHDSAIVIETPETKILNANDAKIAGMPLKHVVKKHGPFNFALRSHSTANFRACINIENDVAQTVDDNEHYSRSFKLFMDAVRPQYAIPFASNHCHLHKDTYHFNTLITNPVKLRDWITQNGGLSSSELCIMLPGSSWHSATGFTLQDLEPFHQLEQKLLAYQKKTLPILTEYYDYESKQALNQKIIEKHEKHLECLPWFLRKVMLGGLTLAYKIIQNENQHFYFSIDYKNCKMQEIDEAVMTQQQLK